MRLFIHEAESGWAIGRLWPASKESLSLSLFHLAHLLRAGVGLDDALQEVQLLEQGRGMRRLWRDIAERVRSGESLSDAMRAWPAAFDDVLVALVKSGEVNGELEEACTACCEVLDWNTTSRARMITAMLYPCFALLVLTGVVIFLFVSVVPSLEGFLQATQAGLAWHTRGLLFVSGFLGRIYLPLLAVLVLLVLFIIALRRTLVTFRLLSDHCLLRLPLIGKLLLELSLSRYAGICGRLYRSGVELDQALCVGETVLRNTALRQCLSSVRASLVAGATLAESVSGVASLPPSFRRILAAGESAGALGQALSQAGDQHQRHAKLQLDRMERLAGPLTLSVVGMNLLWIIISVLGPVYESAIDAVLLS